MIIDTKKTEVKTSGIKQQNGFKIAANASMMSILSDKLYSNKPLAVVRELICNAWDSHVQAGKEDVDVVVSLPTRFNSTFSVKDEGIGLCHDDIMELYTTYGVSLKGQTNNQIGGFGLGSKSPFAYTSQFSVVSNWEGVKRTYTAYLDEDGMPQMTLLGEQSTTDTRGIEVSLPVKTEDTTAFTRNASNFLYFADSMKIKTIGLDLDYDGITRKMETPLMMLVSTDRNSTLNLKESFYVRMGGVVYPVSSSDISFGRETDDWKVFSSLQYTTGCTIIIEMKMGSISLAPNREALSYDKNTCLAILAGVVKAVESVGEVVEEQAKEVKTYCEAKIFHDANQDSISIVNTNKKTKMKIGGFYLGDLRSPKTFLGNTLEDSIDLEVGNPLYGLQGVCVRIKGYRSQADQEFIMPRFEVGGITSSTLKYTSYIVPNYGKKEAYLLYSNGYTCRHLKEKIKALYAKGFKNVYLLKTKRSFEGDSKALIKKGLKFFGSPKKENVFWDDKILEKEAVKALETTTSYGSYQRQKYADIYTFVSGNYWDGMKKTKDYDFNRDNIEAVETCYYVPIFRTKPTMVDFKENLIWFNRSLPSKTLYGIPKDTRKLVEALKNWVELTPALIKKEAKKIFRKDLTYFSFRDTLEELGVLDMVNSCSYDQSSHLTLGEVTIEELALELNKRKSLCSKVSQHKYEALGFKLTPELIKKHLKYTKKIKITEQQKFLVKLSDGYQRRTNKDKFETLWKQLGDK